MARERHLRARGDRDNPQRRKGRNMGTTRERKMAGGEKAGGKKGTRVKRGRGGEGR